MREGSKISSPTNVERMDEIRTARSMYPHLVQRMAPTQPFSFTEANFDTGTSVISTTRAATNERFSRTSNFLESVPWLQRRDRQWLGRRVLMDRRFGRRRQRGGSWIETWLSMPWAVLWMRRATPFDRFQDKQVEIGHGYTYEIMSGYRNKKRGGRRPLNV
jgi:hypothetical protein